MRQETLRVVSEHQASEALESHRKPDPYPFPIIDGLLIYSNGLPVKDQIKRGTPLLDREYRIVEELEDWANRNKGGVFVWVSAPYPGEYPIAKVVISEILTTGEGKTLKNRAIVFDFSPQETIRFANNLAPYSKTPLYFINTETLRETPIFLKDDTHWTYVLQALQPTAYDWQGMREDRDLEEKEALVILIQEIIKKRGAINTRSVLLRQGVITSAQISCPTRVFEIFFNCPRCHGSIPSDRGITTCPHCGITKEEAGSKCA